MINNKIKIILGIIAIILLMIVTLVVLFITGVIPDTRDLTCYKTSEEGNYQNNYIILVKFKNNGLVEDAEYSNELIFQDIKPAEYFFNQMKSSIGDDWKKYISIEDNKVIILYEDELSDDMKKIKRKQLKKQLEGELYLYECQ